MNMQVQGRIHTAFPAEQVTQRFKKREFVLELDAASRYPQLVLFQLTGDRCPALDDYATGDTVAVEFSLRGREWKSPKGETRYFNSLEVWSIARAGDEQESSAGGKSAGGGPTRRSGRSEDEPPPHTDDDEIPF
jgi:single-stranded DNA-binding protein